MCFYQRHQGAVAKSLHQQISVFLPGGESVFNLDPVGSFIWQNLSQKKSYSDLLEAILTEYRVSKKQARADLDQFLEQMLDFGLITEVR